MKKSLFLLVLATLCAISVFAADFSVGDTIVITYTRNGTTYYLAATNDNTVGTTDRAGLETRTSLDTEYCFWVVEGTAPNYMFRNLGRSVLRGRTDYLYHYTKTNNPQKGDRICLNSSTTNWQLSNDGRYNKLSFYSNYQRNTCYIYCDRNNQYRWNFTTNSNTANTVIHVYHRTDEYQYRTNIDRVGSRTREDYGYNDGCSGSFTYTVTEVVDHSIRYESTTAAPTLDKSEKNISNTISNFSAAFVNGTFGDATLTYSNGGSKTFTVTPECHPEGTTLLSDVIRIPFQFSYTNSQGNTITENASVDFPVTQVTAKATQKSSLTLSLSPATWEFPKVGGTKTFTLSATKNTWNELVYCNGERDKSAEVSESFAIDMTSYSDPVYLRHSGTSEFQIQSYTSNTITVYAPDASEKNTDPVDTLEVYYQYTQAEGGDGSFYYARAPLSQLSKYSSGTKKFEHQKGASGRDFVTNEFGITLQGVHTQTKLVYVPQGSSVTLRLPEPDFKGYQRCYDYTTDGKPSGVSTPTGATSLGGNNYERGWARFNTSMNEPTFTLNDNKVHYIAMDISNYTDYINTTNRVVEPTLSYRVIFEIHPATDISSVISTCTGTKYYEEYDLIAPTGNRIMLSTKFDYNGGNYPFYYYSGNNKVNNYAWYDNGTKINNPTTGSHALYVSSNSVGTHVYTLVCNNKNIAKFTVEYQSRAKVGPADNTGCKNGVLISDAEMDAKYTLLTKLTFDADEGFPRPGTTNVVVCNTPLGWDESTYGFVYRHGSASGSHNDQKPQNFGTNDFPHYGEYILVNHFEKGEYFKAADNIGGAENGYFIYCDGTQTAGMVANLRLHAQLCAGSQMFCSAYINNIATGNGQVDLEFVFVGIDAFGEEHALTTFNTGELDFRADGCDANKDNGWRQVFFAIKSDGNYEDYRLQVFDRTASGYGNDFAIDDIRIYVSRPPILAYQATTTCASDEGDTLAAVVRMDYNSLSGVDWQGKPIYYQWVNSDTGDSLDIRYLNENVAGKYGWCTFPEDTALIPQADRYPNIESFMEQRELNPSLTTCYIKEVNDEGKSNYVMYVVHDASMPAGYTYTLRMATAPSELANTMCGMSTDLDIYGATEITLNGEVEKESMYSDLCGNQMYRLAIALFNSERDYDNTIHLMRGHCLSDWLKGNPADSTDAWCISTYGYTYDQIKQAIVSDLRRESIEVYEENSMHSEPNPNSTATALDQIQTKYLKLPNTMTIISHLVNEGFLILGQQYLDVFVPADEDAEFPEYMIFPIAGTGLNDTTSEVMGVCTDAKEIALRINGNRETYQLVIGSKGESLPATIANESRGFRMAKSQVNDKIKLPISNTNARAGIVELYNSTDPDFESAKSTPFKYTHDNAENIGDTLELTLSGENTFSMKPGYDYMFEIHLRSPHGYDSISDCPIGSTYFTVYVIPDTVVWSPKGTNNAWNNDDNWSMFNGGVSAKGYVPNDGANVIIPDLGVDGVYPVLPVTTVVGEKQKAPTESGATDYITYNLNYQTHNCNKIHFEGNAQILNQHMLNYNQVWCEMVLPTQRWQMMAFPVNGVVSGDMYVPADNYASAVPFSSGNTCTGRYPYQFWQSVFNKSVTTKTQDNKSVDVSSVSWSAPTNAVAYEYPVGAAGAFWGYNAENVGMTNLVIRLPKSDTQYSYYDSYGAVLFSETVSRPSNNGKLGFVPEIVAGDTVMTISITNANSGNLFLLGNPALAGLNLKRLIEDNSDVLSGTFYYLPNVENSDNLDMSVCTQYTGTDEEYILPPYRGVLLQTKSDMTTLEVKVRPNMFMLTKQAAGGSTQPVLAPARRSARRASEENDVTLLYLTAQMGDYYSSLVIGETSQAENEFVQGEDAELLTFADNTMETSSSHATLYTPVDEKALSVDILNELQSVPVSFHLCNPEDYRDHFTMWFGDVDQFAYGLQFYDAQTQTTIPLMNGMMLELESPQSGAERYFIQRLGYKESKTTTDVDDLASSMVSAYTQPGNRVCVVATDGIQSVRAYTTAGQLVQEIHNIGSTNAELTLPQGVYMVSVETRQGENAVRKVVVR